MGDPNVLTLVLYAAVAGGLSHQLLFKPIEVDTNPLLIGLTFLSSPFVLSYGLKSLYPQYAEFATWLSFGLVCIFISSLFCSIFLYRAYFHPLRKFPGPLRAKYTKIWALTQAAKTGLKWYQVDADLHKKYGDYVRTGPRELSITDPAAIPLVLGFSSKTGKGPFYDSLEDSVSTTRDRDFHKQRRKIWDSAMKQLLVSYGPQLEEFTDTFLDRIEEVVGKAIIINEITLHYSYDVMTQLAFGKAGGFLSGASTKAANEVMTGIQKGIDAIGLLSQVPWIMTLLTIFAGLGGPMKVFNDWSNQALVRRKKEGSKSPDLMGYLIDATKPDRKGNSLLFSESRAIIGAGSDTTATALTEIFILLAHFPSYIQKIREEMDPIFSSGAFSCQIAYPILESVIMETLRLHPPVLFGSQRVTPAEGLHIGKVYIPGDMVVYIPPWQILHDARNFAQPDDFIPERWTSQSELIKNRSAYIPFNIGPGNCPGRPLAMMELRSVIARTLQNYDVSFPKGYEFDVSFFKGVKDHFVAGVPKMKLVFSKRTVV